MPFSIRPFASDDRDYAARAAFVSAHFPEHPTTPAELRDEDARRPAKIQTAQFTAETPQGEIVGVGRFGQSLWDFDPNKFNITILVAPDKQNAGIGGALYDHVMENLALLVPQKLTGYVREDMPQSVAFALRRGFTEEMREWESKLSVPDFDFAPWKNASQKAAQNGVIIRSLAELAAVPDRDRTVWEAEMIMAADVPSPDPFTPMPFDEYEKLVLTDPHFLPDAFFVAIHEPTGEYVGTSTLWKRASDNDLNTGLTAVKREWRRKGIALALKLRAIEFAKTYGAGSVRTENASTNEAMLSINVALGFVRQPAWISYGKFLPSGEAE